MEPEHPCRHIPTRACPPVYEAVCPGRCVRYEMDVDEAVKVWEADSDIASRETPI